ncbi:hypothetical protein [uncultured Helicobacter sp.]
MPNRVPDAVALKSHRISPKNTMYDRVSGGVGGSALSPDNKFCTAKLVQ